MILVPTNLLAFPLFVLLWTLDAYLVAIVLRVVLCQLGTQRNGRLCSALMELIDPLAQRVEHRLQVWRCRPSPRWMTWAIIVTALLLARSILSSVLFAVLSKAPET